MPAVWSAGAHKNKRDSACVRMVRNVHATVYAVCILQYTQHSSAERVRRRRGTCLITGDADVGKLLHMMRTTDSDVAMKGNNDHGPDPRHAATCRQWPENHLHVRLYLLHSTRPNAHCYDVWIVLH